MPCAIKCVHADPATGARTMTGTAEWLIYDRERDEAEYIADVHVRRRGVEAAGRLDHVRAVGLGPVHHTWSTPPQLSTESSSTAMPRGSAVRLHAFSDPQRCRR
jgi:hypothetical protein